MGALLYNVITAMGDSDLTGDTLLTPVRKCADWYQYTFSIPDPSQEICKRAEECFTRSLVFLLATILVIPSVVLASLGAGSKLVDLYRKFDEKVSPASEVSDYLPPILKLFSRTGDRTVAYLRARFVADKTEMPLKYNSFEGSKIFAFDQLEKNIGPKYYRDIVYLETPEQIQGLKDADKIQSILYLLPFAPFNRELRRESKSCSFPAYQPDWGQYQGRLEQLLAVKSEKLDLPKDAYKIALHVRDGGNYDDKITKTLHPLKLPSLNFYVGELIKVINMKEEEKKFFVHIFTDAIHPEKVLEQISSQVQIKNASVTFSYTPIGKATLQYDAGNMDRFQCMIRADSNLSGTIVAASSTELDIFPSGFDTKDNNIMISEVTQNTRGVDGVNTVKRSTCYSKPMEGYLPSWFKNFFYRYFGVHQVPLKQAAITISI